MLEIKSMWKFLRFLKNETMIENHNNYSYSAIFEFNGEKEDIDIIHITDHVICPNARLVP